MMIGLNTMKRSELGFVRFKDDRIKNNGKVRIKIFKI